MRKGKVAEKAKAHEKKAEPKHEASVPPARTRVITCKNCGAPNVVKG
jgi:hypothetical protein